MKNLTLILLLELAHPPPPPQQANIDKASTFLLERSPTEERRERQIATIVVLADGGSEWGLGSVVNSRGHHKRCRLPWLKRETHSLRGRGALIPTKGQTLWWCMYTIIQAVTKRCRLSWLTNRALVYEPECGGGGDGGVSASANEYSCAQGAQINFGDLIPYLTYEF